ncbi:MAG TPA: hypothetical protein VGP80_16045 [Gemmatimonadales bacterium]|nr:hypothetical protein [Gemmatimonadales bacterium]
MRPFITLLLVTAGSAALACSDPNALAKPANSNFDDTLTIYALHGTPINTPSAFSVPEGPVRTDRSPAFEFAYDVGPQGEHLFLPLAVLDINVSNSVNPGLLPSSKPFVAIHRAPSNGYITADTVVVDSGDVFVVRSRLVCNIGVSEYAKLQVLSFDDAQRSVTFRVLSNINCGYKDLDPGFPKD